MEVEKGHREVLDHRPLKEDLQIDQQDKSGTGVRGGDSVL
jgi:hypothetical protein